MPGPESPDDDLLSDLSNIDPDQAQVDPEDVYGDVTIADPEVLEPEVPAFRDDPDLNPFNLTPQELMFCYAYARAQNGAQAARYAKYSGGSSQATKLLQRDDMQAEIRRISGSLIAMQQQVQQPASAGEVLSRYWEVANASPADLFRLQEDGKTYRYIALADMPPALRRSIKRIKIKDGEIVDIELHDPMGALGKLAGFQGLSLGNRMGAWSDAGGQTGEDGEAEVVLPKSAPTKPTTTLTFEQMVSADGSKLLRKSITKSG